MTSQHRYQPLNSETIADNIGEPATPEYDNGDVELRSVGQLKSDGQDADSNDTGTDTENGDAVACLIARPETETSAGREDLKDARPTVYPQRWTQLGYLSALALISDWVCFSTASIPTTFEQAYPEKTSEGLIDKFLFMNVLSCLIVTDTVARFGLETCTKASALLMALGCWLRSGLGIVPVVFELLGIREDYASLIETEVFGVNIFGLPPYPIVVVGTLMVGMAQPFFQCTPPLLSATWFASNERATATAIALNFNQMGIAAAFFVGGMMADDLNRYFVLIAVLSTVLSIGTFCQFKNAPPIPPSASELSKVQSCHQEPAFHVSVRKFFATPGFRQPLVAFIYSIAITNVVGAFIDEVMERGGVTDTRHIGWAGCGFEFAIVLGGIILGKYVDRTKGKKLWDN